MEIAEAVVPHGPRRAGVWTPFLRMSEGGSAKPVEATIRSLCRKDSTDVKIQRLCTAYESARKENNQAAAARRAAPEPGDGGGGDGGGEGDGGGGEGGGGDGVAAPAPAPAPT